MLNRKSKWLKPLLLPAGFFFRMAVGLRNLLFDYKWIESKSFKIPVISVGNITVGGTGKTPLIEYLAGLLQDSYQVAVVSRGYKRKSKGFRLVGSDASVSEAGDEPRQIKRKFPRVTVAVDARRSRAIQRLKEQNPSLQVVLLDDAFQHRYVAPGLTILMVDYNRPPCFDRMLPAGDLREPVSSLDRADIVVVTKVPQRISPMDQRIFSRNLNLYPYQSIFFTKLAYGSLQSVFGPVGSESAWKNRNFDGFKAIIISGIASPAPFELQVSHMMPVLACRRFADHYAYTVSDMVSIEAMLPEGEKKVCFITTEKDAVRLAELRNHIVHPDRWFYLPVSLSFVGDGETRFKKEVLKYVASNRRNNILHR